jgi:hypothetical protein
MANWPVSCTLPAKRTVVPSSFPGLSCLSGVGLLAVKRSAASAPDVAMQAMSSKAAKDRMEHPAARSVALAPRDRKQIDRVSGCAVRAATLSACA